MSAPKERDEQEFLELDEIFRATLDRVRPHILGLTIAGDKQLCRLWLDKLDRAKSQRSLRNCYLLELCRHLKSGHVGGIFGKPPRDGPLLPLPRFCNHTVEASSSPSDLSDTSDALTHVCSGRSSAKQRRKTSARRRSSSSAGSLSCDYSIADTPVVRLCDKIRSDRNHLAAQRQRMDSMTVIVKELQSQNERLKRDLAYARENCECNDESANLRSTIERLTGEITELRTKLVEVENMKDELEKNHRDIVQQYKTTMTEEIEELNSRLREADSKNAELYEKISSTNRRLEEIIIEKEQETTTMERNFKEQIEIIEQNFKEQMGIVEQNFKEQMGIVELNCQALLDEKDKSLLLKDEIILEKNTELAEMNKMRMEEVESLSNNVRDLEEKLRIKIDDEGKLQSFMKEQCSTMKEDLARMRNDMEIASQSQNDNLVKKISALKRAILRLEKSKERLGIDCAKKISHVLETKELEIKSLQLQLQEQRSELTTSLSSEKQCELERLAGLLEERYKALLSATDANAGNQRKFFLTRITILENQMTLLKHGLEFDNESTVV